LPNRNSEDKKAALGTRAVWAGENGPRWERATQVPVALGVSFGYDTIDDWLEVALGKAPGHIYSRNTNPTVAAFEEKVRDLETAEAATSFASGMAAISNTLLTLLSPGDRVVTVKDTYGGTNKLFIEFFPASESTSLYVTPTIPTPSNAPLSRDAKPSTSKPRPTPPSRFSTSDASRPQPIGRRPLS
jgi:O-acetylhomoserine/O-acetylserine sulfhydrylase-like pyridoxal-dependent enzyme